MGSSALGRAQRKFRPWSFFFDSILEATFFDFEAILGGFGRPKMEAKIDFWEVLGRLFFEVRFGIDFGSIFGGSEPVQC